MICAHCAYNLRTRQHTARAQAPCLRPSFVVVTVTGHGARVDVVNQPR